MWAVLEGVHQLGDAVFNFATDALQNTQARDDEGALLALPLCLASRHSRYLTPAAAVISFETTGSFLRSLLLGTASG